MKAVILARQGHQLESGNAFALGLRRHGWSVSILPRPEPCDLLVMWGVRREEIIRRQLRDGGEVCILERGYLGDRFQWTSVSFGGGLNGRGRFHGPFEDGSRFEAHFAPLMRDWTHRDGPAVIMGQVPADMSLKGLDPFALWIGAARDLAEQGVDVRFRGHPKANGFGLPGVERIGGDLAEVLGRAGLVVTINSNAGVDAVMAGVPTITMDERAMAWPVTGHRVDEVIRPDRLAWARAMAWKQWRLDEMASGDCWAAIGGGCADQDAADPKLHAA